MKRVSKAGLILFVVAVIVFNHFIYNPVAGPHPAKHTLNELEKQSLALLLEMTKLLFSLSTALFALIGFFVVTIGKDGGELETTSRRDAIVAFAFAALSIDFGYIFMEKWVELLGNSMFAPFDFIVLLPHSLQFITFCLALFFSACLALREMPKIGTQKGDGK